MLLAHYYHLVCFIGQGVCVYFWKIIRPTVNLDMYIIVYSRSFMRQCKKKNDYCTIFEEDTVLNVRREEDLFYELLMALYFF